MNVFLLVRHSYKLYSSVIVCCDSLYYYKVRLDKVCVHYGVIWLIILLAHASVIHREKYMVSVSFTQYIFWKDNLGWHVLHSRRWKIAWTVLLKDEVWSCVGLSLIKKICTAFYHLALRMRYLDADSECTHCLIHGRETDMSYANPGFNAASNDSSLMGKCACVW